MSFPDAIGQIDQIVQWEQQLTDPAALTQTTSTGGNTATDDTSGTGGTDASTNSTFAQTLAQAQDTTTAATATDPTDATATPTSMLAPTATSSSDLLSGGDSQLMASLSGLSSSSADEAAGATTSTDPTDEASALESALNSTGATALSPTGATGATISPALVEGESGAAGGTATSPADPRIDAMTEEANALVGKPYVWGGGHDGWGPQSGYDCSGFVSAVLHAGGYLSTPQDTTTLPASADMESGPGQYVTVYDRDKPGQQGHVIINIAGQFYESGGQSGSWGGGGGVEQIATPSAKYLSTFDTILHPAGL